MSRRRVMIVVCAIVAGSMAPSSLRAQEARISTEIQGVRGPLRENVLATLSLTRAGSSAVSRERLDELLERAPGEVRTALEPFGYYEALVRDSVALRRGRWSVILDIEPGAPVIVSSARIRVEGEGADDPAFRELTARPAEMRGQALSHREYEELKSSLSQTAANRGYLDAAFDSAVVSVNRTTRTADIALVFASGPRYRLGPVTFVQDVLDPALLQRLVPWRPGDTFDGARLLELRAAVTDGPNFTGVEILPRRDLAQGLVVPIEVTLFPSRSQRYSVGVGYGSDTGPRTTLSAEFRRLTRGGQRAEVDAWLATVERRVTARYFIPLRSRRASLLSLSTGFVDSNPATSDTETWLLGASVSGLVSGWRSETSLTFQRSDFEVGIQSGTTTLLLLGAGVSRVRADDRVDPRRGELVQLRTRGGLERLGGEVSLLETALEARLIRSPAPRFRVRLRAQVGALFTSDFSALPGSIRYFAGGDRSIRGFGYRAVGPTDPQGNELGGSRLLVGSTEVEFRFLPGWGVAGFVDGGGALGSFSDALEGGVGGGIRWRSPIGMIRLDLAFAVTEPGAPVRLHFAMGPEL